MKKIVSIIGLFVTTASCLVPPAPHTDWYKPVNYSNIIYYNENKNSKSAYYEIETSDSLKVLSTLAIGSYPQKKYLGYHLNIINNHSKRISFSCNDVRLNSNSVEINVSCKENQNEIIISPKDSIKVNFTQIFDMNDNQWYNRYEQYDTIWVNIRLEHINYEIPFYFNKKNQLETYPF